MRVIDAAATTLRYAPFVAVAALASLALLTLLYKMTERTLVPNRKAINKRRVNTSSAQTPVRRAATGLQPQEPSALREPAPMKAHGRDTQAPAASGGESLSSSGTSLDDAIQPSDTEGGTSPPVSQRSFSDEPSQPQPASPSACSTERRTSGLSPPPDEGVGHSQSRPDVPPQSQGFVPSVAATFSFFPFSQKAAPRPAPVPEQPAAPPKPPALVPRTGPVSAAEQEQVSSVRAFWKSIGARERKAIACVKTARVLEVLRAHYGASRACVEILQRAHDALTKAGGVIGVVRGAAAWAPGVADEALAPAVCAEEPVEATAAPPAAGAADVVLVSSRKDGTFSVSPDLLSASVGERLVALLARRVARIAAGGAGRPEAALPERSLARAASCGEAAEEADGGARRAAVEGLGPQAVVLAVAWRLILDRLVGAYVGHQRRQQAGPLSCPGSPPGGLQSAASAPASMGRPASEDGSGEEYEGPEDEQLSTRSSSRASSPPRPATAPLGTPAAPVRAAPVAPTSPPGGKARGGVVTLAAATEAAKDGAVRRTPGDGSSRSARKRKNKKGAGTGGPGGPQADEPASTASLASNASHSDSGVSRDASPRPAWAVPPEPARGPLQPLRAAGGVVPPPLTGAVDTTSPQYRAIFAQYYRAYMAASTPPLPVPAPAPAPAPATPPVSTAGSPSAPSSPALAGALGSQSMFSSDPLRLVSTRRPAGPPGSASPTAPAPGAGVHTLFASPPASALVPGSPPFGAAPFALDAPRPSPLGAVGSGRLPGGAAPPPGTSSPTAMFWASLASEGAAGPAAPSPAITAVSGRGSVAFPDPTCPAIWEPLGKGAIGGYKPVRIPPQAPPRSSPMEAAHNGGGQGGLASASSWPAGGPHPSAVRLSAGSADGGEPAWPLFSA